MKQIKVNLVKNYTIKSIIVIIIGFSIFKINTIVLKKKEQSRNTILLLNQ